MFQLKMHYINLILICSLQIHMIVTDKDTVPVFMLDYSLVMPENNISPNPFNKISAADFSNIMLDAIKRSDVVVLFIEDQFSMEDISIKDKDGTPYTHLRKGLLAKKAKFLPAVLEPYAIINQIFQPQPLNVFHFSSTSVKKDMFDGHFKHYYVFFQDCPNETRVESLRRHDKIMHDVYSTIRAVIPACVAFYTGKTNPVSLGSMQFVAIKPIGAPKVAGVTVISGGAMFRFVGVYATSVSRRSIFNQRPTITEETWTRNKRLSTRMAYADFELQFNFTFRKDGWLLDNVALLEGGEEVGYTNMGVGAPWSWSYVCSEPLNIINNRDGSTVVISQYQIQPLQEEGGVAEGGDAAGVGNGGGGGGGDSSFGDSINCGPYFNAGILSGLFVTAICTCILAYGLAAMISCSSNDRYDDPLVKTNFGS